MTTPVDAASAPPRAPEPPPATAGAHADDAHAPVAINEICPYLLASHGGWRSASPNRDHRCTAVDPPGQLPTDKQRRLCLTAEHAGCPAFRAARVARASMLAPGLDPAIVASADAARRPVPRTTAVILEQPRIVGGRSVFGGEWPLAQAALVALMVVAFIVVLVARLSPTEPAGGQVPVVTDSPSPAVSLEPLPTFSPVPAPPSFEPSGSAPPSPSAAPTLAPPPAPAYRTKYRVRAGDTLIAIAARFGTTVSAIKRLNGISGSNLRIGQILKIP